MTVQSASTTYRVVKRALDILVSSLALLALAPVFAIIALCIFAQDPTAPVFFQQRRCGKGGRTFGLFKFRTMVKNADQLKEQLRHLSTVPWPDFRLDNDPRVTRVGRFLRKTSLDELPQFANVLLGHMTLVGPRPTSFKVDTYALWQTGRLDHRPGLTGPWQVDGRNTLDFDDRCRLEISFFRRPSIVRELWLLVRTVGVVVRRTGVA